jgi:protein-S-isoprenylcysteine O-methyltransferase Ste14
MPFVWPSLATLVLTIIAAIASFRVLIAGFKRRGKGVKYEQDFLIQRAPQLSSIATIVLIIPSFLMQLTLLKVDASIMPFFTLSWLLPQTITVAICWLGVAVLISGLIFMIGGWYSLGESFSTDAEVLHDHNLRKNGLLQFVMHPAYSGIIQSLFGAALACISPICLVMILAVVAPLWLNRAKYEEQLMIETFGQEYKDYGNQLHWRRLIPTFLPIGV